MQSFKQEYDQNRHPMIDADTVESQRDTRCEIVGSFYKMIIQKTIVSIIRINFNNLSDFYFQ